jgi:hypothetical protein
MRHLKIPLIIAFCALVGGPPALYGSAQKDCDKIEVKVDQRTR